MADATAEPTRRGRARKAARIEELAEAELAKVPSYVWDGRTLPVPIEHIADSHYGLHVREAADLSRAPGAPILDSEQTLSGLLLPDRGEIWVNAIEAESWPARRRFTISHELGHWCLHRDAHDASIYCRSMALDPPRPVARQPRPAVESEADAFAAALLMPGYLIRHHHAELWERRDAFQRLCELFGASAAAMAHRLNSHL